MSAVKVTSMMVECYEVGNQQIIDLWEQSNLRVNVGIGKNCFVLVELRYRFGRVGNPEVIYCTCELSDVIAMAQAYVSAESVSRAAHRRYLHDYEVWQVMDDGELWQLWEHEVEMAKRKSLRGRSTDWHVYRQIGGVCLLDMVQVPVVLYHLLCMDTVGQVVSDYWYDDGYKYMDGLDYAISEGYELYDSDVYPMDAKVIIMNDYGRELDDYGIGSVLEVELHESC